MKSKILKFVLIFQGFYYSVTAFWAIIALDHFARVTSLHLESLNTIGRFEMESIVALSFVLGIFFILSANKRTMQRPAGFLALGIAIAVIIPELIYLPQIGNPPLFWLDFAEESIVALLLITALFSCKR